MTNIVFASNNTNKILEVADKIKNTPIKSWFEDTNTIFLTLISIGTFLGMVIAGWKKLKKPQK